MRFHSRFLLLALLIAMSLPVFAAKNPLKPKVKPQPTDLCDLLKDSPAYVEGLRFSDFTSNISIGADNPTGVGTIALDYNGHSRILSGALASLEVVSPNGDSPLIMSPCGSFPHGIRATGTSADLDAQWFTTFVATDVIACILDLTNKGATDLTLIPRISGGTPESANVDMGGTFDAQNNMMIYRLRESYRPSESAPEEVVTAHVGVLPSFLPTECLLGESRSELKKNWAYTGKKAECLMTGAPFVLSAGQTRRLWMLVGVSTEGRIQMIESIAAQMRQMDSVPSMEKAARRRVDDLLDRLPKPAGEPPVKKLYYRSACTLVRNMASAGGKFGSNHPCFDDRSKSVVTPQSASMMAIALAEIDPALAREQIQILTDNIMASGAMPEWISRESVSTNPSVAPPLAAWAAWQVYQREKDDKFLKQVIGPLGAWTDWWMSEHDRDFDNLCERVSTFDLTPPEQIYDSPGLSSAVAVQMRCLSAMSKALGRDIPARAWTARAVAVEQRIAQILYDQNANFFFDAAINSHLLQKAVSPEGVMPLWAAVPLPTSKEKNMVRDYLMNPKRFFGAVPFTDIPADDPKFGPDTRLTPLTAYIMMDALRAARPGRKGEFRGYPKEAQRAARQYLGFVSKLGVNCQSFDVAGNGYGPESGVTSAVSLATILGRFDSR